MAYMRLMTSEPIKVESSVDKPDVCADVIGGLVNNVAQSSASRNERLAALERLRKYRKALPSDFCYKTELAKARDE